MSKMKKKSRKYDPHKAKNHFKSKRMGRCILFRWESRKEDASAFFCAGPYPEDQCIDLAQHSMEQLNNWQMIIISCFVDDAGNYYEDFYTPKEVMPQCVLASSMDLVNGIEESILETIHRACNPNHLVDVVTILALRTDNLLEKMKSDSWHQKESSRRAQLILEKVSKNKVEEVA